MKLIITLLTFTVLVSACKNPLEESGVTYNKNTDPNKATIKLNPEADPGPVYQVHEPATPEEMGDFTTVPLWNCSVFENERHEDTCHRIKKTMQKDYMWDDNGFAVSCTTLPSHLKTDCEDLARNLFKNERAFDCEKKLQFSYNSNSDTEIVRCKLIQKSYTQGLLLENLKALGGFVKAGEAKNQFTKITEQEKALKDMSVIGESNSLLEESLFTEDISKTSSNPTSDPSMSINEEEAEDNLEEATQELGVKTIPIPEWRPERPKKKPTTLSSEEAARQLGVKQIPVPTFRDSIN